MFPQPQKQCHKYLETLPRDLQFFLEVRNPDWFSNKEETDDLLNILSSLKVSYVITDAAGRQDCAHRYLTVPKLHKICWKQSCPY